MIDGKNTNDDEFNHGCSGVDELNRPESNCRKSIMFACGKNDHSQLFITSSDDGKIITPFTTVQLLDCGMVQDVVYVANGDMHTLILTREGQVYGIGNNVQGN